MGHPMTTELDNNGFLAKLANHYKMRSVTIVTI